MTAEASPTPFQNRVTGLLGATWSSNPAFLNKLSSEIDAGRTNDEKCKIRPVWLGVPTSEKRRC